MGWNKLLSICLLTFSILTTQAYASLKTNTQELTDYIKLAIDSRNGNNSSQRAFSSFSSKLKQSDRQFAYRTLGGMYLYGENLNGVYLNLGNDYEEAFYWLDKASALGDSQSKIMLAQMFDNGYGVVINQGKANKLRAEAASLGLVDKTIGTGFFVNNKDIVTNKHVVQGCSSVSVTHNGKKYAATIKSTSSKEDLAILHSPLRSQYHATLANNTNVEESDRVYISGYSSAQYKYTMAFITDPLTTTVLHIPGSHRLRNAKRMKFRRSEGIGRGDSGSAVIDKYGNIVGVMDSQEFNNNSASSLVGHHKANAIPASILSSFLNANHISFEVNENNSSSLLDEVYAKTASKFSVMVTCIK